MRSSVILIAILLLAACSPTSHPISFPEITDVVASSTPVSTQQPSPIPTRESPTSTPKMAIVELKGDFEGYSAHLDENGTVKFITDSDGKTILPDPSTGVFKISTKNNLYFYDKKNKKMAESVIKEEEYIKYWDKDAGYYSIVYMGPSRLSAKNLAKTLVGSVAFSDDEKAAALVLPGGSCINPTYDGDFPVPNRPGWFYVWDEAGKTLVEKELGEIIEFDRVDMEILGKKVPFVIGTDRNADIREPWEEIGIETLMFNPENENIEESVMKMFTATMWMVSDAARNGATYDDFMGNITDPSNKISLPGARDFTLDEITGVNYIFKTKNDKASNTTGEQEYLLSDDGILNIIRTPGDAELQDVKNSILLTSYGNGGEQGTGKGVSSFIENILRLRNDGTSDDFNSRIEDVYKICGDIRKMTSTYQKYLSDILINGIWYAKVNR